MDHRGLAQHEVVGRAGRGRVVGRAALAQELVVRGRVDALGGVRLVRVVAADRRRGRRRAAVVAVHRAARAARVVERERVEVDRLLAEALLIGRDVEVAQQAGLAARTADRRRAAHQEAQLAPRDLRGGRAALRRDLGVAVEALAPLLAIVVALAGVGVREVLRERDVVVRVDQAGRDRAVGAHDLGLAALRAVAADARDLTGGVVRDLAALVDGRRRQHGALDQRARAVAGDRARAGRQRRQRLARDLGHRRPIRWRVDAGIARLVAASATTRPNRHDEDHRQ